MSGREAATLVLQALQVNKMDSVIESYSTFEVCTVVRFLQAEGMRFIAG
jgi:hypothetical protein